VNYAPDLDDYEYQQRLYESEPVSGGESLAAYTKAINTRYRLENWSKEELEAYCGIYENKEEDK